MLAKLSLERAAWTHGFPARGGERHIHWPKQAHSSARYHENKKAHVFTSVHVSGRGHILGDQTKM